MNNEQITPSCGNIFLDMGFPKHEADVLKIRADLMARIRVWLETEKLTQSEAAAKFGVSQARVSDLVRGKWEKFSVDNLLELAAKASIPVKVVVGEAA